MSRGPSQAKMDRISADMERAHVHQTEEESRAKARAERNERVPFDWQLVKVDQTAMCAGPWLKKNKIKTCGVFYLFDRNRHVHICSFQPTYELFPVAGYAESTFRRELTEKESEARFDFEQEMLNTENACEYMDVSQVDKLPRQPVICAPEREPGEDCETYYLRACEEMREYFQGNTPWF